MAEVIRGKPRLSGLIRVGAVASLLLLPNVLSAQVSPAGQWRTLHSEHFRVHFRPGHDSVAHHAVEEGERAWFLLSTELVPPRQSIDLVLSDAADFSNAYASVFPSNRIVVLLTPPTSEPELQNYDDWVRLVVTHELTHIFHLDRVKGPWGVIQAVFGRVPGASPNLYQPSWVTEGIATYYESHFTSRGRVRGSFHSEILLAAAEERAWPRANAATYISEKWPDGRSPYAFGSRFFDYLRQTQSDSSIPRFVEKTSGQWIPFRTGRPLRLATGTRRDSVWSEFQRDYEKSAAARPHSTAEVIVRGRRTQPSPAIANDGSLAWLDAPLDQAPAIVLRRPQAEEERYLTTGGVDLSWNGDTLYATWLELVNPATYRSDLHRLVNGEWERVTHGQRLGDLAVGPQGVIAVKIGENGSRLVRVADTLVDVAPYAPAASSFATPAVDSTGKIVAAWQYQGRYHLLQPTESFGNRMVSGLANEVIADPAFVRSDVASLLYASDRTGLPQIYLLMNDGSVRQITNEPNGARQPAVSGDGWLYFTSLESDGYALKRLRWPMGGLADSRTADSMIGQVGAEPKALPEPPSARPPVRSSGYSSWAALRPHYFIPYLSDKGSAGWFLGAVTSGSDPVGRLFYAAGLAGGFEGGRIDATLSMLYRHWDHHALDFYAAQDHGDAGIVTSPVPATVRSVERDVELGFSTLWRRWYRGLAFRVAGDYEQDRFFSEPAIDFTSPEFVAASAGVSLGRTIRPPLAISDEDGATLSIRYRRRWRLDQDGWSDEWRSRLALYAAIKGLGGFAHPVLAGRITGATSSGPDRETFGIGGASGISYEPFPGIVAGSGRQFPVRGFEAGELRGNTVLVATAEVRVPVALVAEPFWDLPGGLDRISLRLFFDYGRVWEPPISGAPERLQSAGVEMTWDLVVLYDTPLRVRTGLAVPLNDGSVTRRGDVSFGVGFGSDF